MSFQQQDYLLSAKKFEIPESISRCSGIRIQGQIIKSVLLSTDLSYIHHLNSDAIMVMNPFEKSNEINRLIIEFSKKPVICDVGGGFLQEESTIKYAQGAFKAGAAGVIISKPTAPEIVRRIRDEINGKLIYTVMFDGEPIADLVEAGIDIFNISTGENTPEIVEKVRQEFPEMPILASGGPYNSTIIETIEMGAEAIVFNPPTATEILRSVFDEYRFQKA